MNLFKFNLHQKAGFRIELNSELFIVHPMDLKSKGRRQPTNPVITKDSKPK